MTVPLLIDCDPGIDDAVALLLACSSPEVRLLGVTTVAGNVGLAHTTRNARRVLALAGRTDVPVAAGAGRPLVRAQPRRATEVHGEDGVHGAALPEPAAPADPRHAVRLLADAIAGSAAPVTLVAIGPLTNVALLYALHPEMAARLGRLVVMGGSADAGNVTPAAEFNVWSDPEAAYRVLTEPGLPTPVPTALVTLDLTLGVPLAEPDLGRLRAGGPAGRAAAAMLAPALARSRRLHGRNSVPVHDAVAVAEVVRPGLLDLAGCTVTVDCGNGPGRGGTSVDRFAALPWLTVSTGADKEGVIDLLIGRVGRLAPYPS